MNICECCSSTLKWILAIKPVHDKVLVLLNKTSTTKNNGIETSLNLPFFRNAQLQYILNSVPFKRSRFDCLKIHQ